MQTKTKFNELLKLYDMPMEELVQEATKVSEDNFKNKFEFCSIISAKTGKCSENCRYCAQSSHYNTTIDSHPLVSLENIKKAALSAKDNGTKRFSIVTSGSTPNDKDFPKLLEMIKLIENIDGLSSCASIGFLTPEKAKQLKDAGLTRFHHNINTCKSYHPSICSTHTYEDRIDSINLAKEQGIEVCCGAIIGMGESREQRVELALELEKIMPDSAPLNILHPIPGTPFEGYGNKINEEEIIKTIAMLRIALPKLSLRLAGGRHSRLSEKDQNLSIKAGIDSMIVGNLLTTLGSTPQEDLNLIKNNGKTL